MPVRQATLAEIVEYIKPAASRGIQEVVLHHFWSPSLAQYKGLSTWEGVRRYHMESRGWSDIGYHFGADAQGRYWIGRDYRKSGAHVLNRNAHTLGVAMPGNFDVEDPTDSLAHASRLVRVLCNRFSLRPANVRFHREFADKSCPGTRCNLDKFRRQVFEEWPATEDDNPEVALPTLAVVLGGNVVDCSPRLVGGRLTVDAHKFAGSLGIVLPFQVRPWFHPDTERMYVGEAAPWFREQGWVVDSTVWRTETLPDGTVLKRLYPQRVEWLEQ